MKTKQTLLRKLVEDAYQAHMAEFVPGSVAERNLVLQLAVIETRLKIAYTQFVSTGEGRGLERLEASYQRTLSALRGGKGRSRRKSMAMGR